MVFYDKVDALCKARGISITKLAEELNYSKSTPNGWKSGSEPRYKTLKEIAQYFDISIEELEATGDQDVITGSVRTNNGIIGHTHAPVTIVNGSERQLSENEITMLKMLHELGPLEQAKALVYVEDLLNKSKK